MGGFGMHELEIPEVVMRRLSLRDGIVRLRLSSVDDIGEFDGVLDEEDRNVVSNNVPVTFLGIEFGAMTR
jgi:hypothetical protein